MASTLSNTTAILTAAGYATRFLPWSYVIPKEMLPVFIDNVPVPAIQYVFEYLYDSGIRNFVVVVRKYKEAIVSHFSRDDNFLSFLERMNKLKEKEMLEKFFRKVEDSTLLFIPSAPNGFGGAVLSAEKYVHTNYILIAAPDMIIPDRLQLNEENIVYVSTSSKPEKYGVVYGNEYVEMIQEKPKNPKSDKIFLGYAMLDTEIFNFLREEKPDNNGEIQLTPAISRMAKKRKIKIYKVSRYYDIGNPEDYLKYIRGV